MSVVLRALGDLEEAGDTGLIAFVPFCWDDSEDNVIGEGQDPHPSEIWLCDAQRLLLQAQAQCIQQGGNKSLSSCLP